MKLNKKILYFSILSITLLQPYNQVFANKNKVEITKDSKVTYYCLKNNENCNPSGDSWKQLSGQKYYRIHIKNTSKNTLTVYVDKHKVLKLAPKKEDSYSAKISSGPHKITYSTNDNIISGKITLETSSNEL